MKSIEALGSPYYASKTEDDFHEDRQVGHDGQDRRNPNSDCVIKNFETKNNIKSMQDL